MILENIFFHCLIALKNKHLCTLLCNIVLCIAMLHRYILIYLLCMYSSSNKLAETVFCKSTYLTTI